MQNWESEYKNDLTIKILTFLLSPLLGLFYSLYRINTKSSFIILFLTFTTFGFSLVVPEEETDDYNFDSVRYRMWFEDKFDSNLSDFKTDFFDFLNFTGEKDFFSTLLYYVVSYFTHNYHILFMIVAMFFSFFYLKSLRFLVSENNYHFSISCLCILFIFSIVQIQKIVAFRFFIALWIVVFAIFKIFIDFEKKYILLILLTPFFHASFYLFYLLLPIYYVFRRSYKASVIFFILSFVLAELSVSLFTQFLSFLPDSLSMHYDAYVSDDFIAKQREGEGFVWIRFLFEFVYRLMLNIIIIFFIRNYNANIKSTKNEGLFKFLLVLISFINFSFMVPDVGSRFSMIVFPIVAYILLNNFYYQKYRNIIYIFSGIFIFYFIFLPWNIYSIPCLKYYFNLYDFSFFFTSPLVLFSKYILML